jgi:phosphoglycolate phosphatase-like HAD superfamily hydrolase
MARRLPKAVVWDLDGTLSDDRARAHFVEVEQGKKRDWKSYFDAIGADPPIAASMEVLRAMHAAGCRIIFLTGRPEHTRRTTERWLKANGLTAHDRLLMRPPRDYRPSGAFKVDEIAKLRREYELVCAFEDRMDVADALRGAGVPVFLYGAGHEAAAESLEAADASAYADRAATSDGSAAARHASEPRLTSSARRSSPEDESRERTPARRPARTRATPKAAAHAARAARPSAKPRAPSARPRKPKG